MVSTDADELVDAVGRRSCCACGLRRGRVGHDADRERAVITRDLRDDRRRAGARCRRPCRRSRRPCRRPRAASAMRCTSSSAALRPTSGLPPAPSPLVSCGPSWILVGARLVSSACASVLAAMNSTPSRPLGDHGVERVAAAAAHADDLDPRVQLRVVRELDRDCPFLLPPSWRLPLPVRHRLCRRSGSPTRGRSRHLHQPWLRRLP